MSDHETLATAILARGTLTLTDAEKATLEAAPADYLPARKILGAHAFNTGDMVAAVALTGEIYAREPNAETALNRASTLSRARRLDEAAAFLAAAPEIPELDRATRLSEVYARLGDAAANRTWALKALELKEAEAPVIEDRPPPRLARFDPETPARNVIAYSLFGAAPRYLDGAVRNAIVARYLYPGWTPRFYVDKSVPAAACKALEDNGAELRMVPKLPAARYGLFWRFLVEDDEGVDIYLVRDADSVPSLREAVAVADWLASGQPFHVMRDWPTHSELVLAGLWGAHRGNIPGGIGQRILGFCAARRNVLNSRSDDQLFLRREIWPWMRGRAFVQDSVFGYGATGAFDPRFVLPGNRHVGQDDYAVRPGAGQRPVHKP